MKFCVQALHEYNVKCIKSAFVSAVKVTPSSTAHVRRRSCCVSNHMTRSPTQTHTHTRHLTLHDSSLSQSIDPPAAVRHVFDCCCCYFHSQKLNFSRFHFALFLFTFFCKFPMPWCLWELSCESAHFIHSNSRTHIHTSRMADTLPCNQNVILSFMCVYSVCFSDFLLKTFHVFFGSCVVVFYE